MINKILRKRFKKFNARYLNEAARKIDRSLARQNCGQYMMDGYEIMYGASIESRKDIISGKVKIKCIDKESFYFYDTKTKKKVRLL